jgi:YegS/Rv2252/BmrU family lipid kinase
MPSDATVIINSSAAQASKESASHRLAGIFKSSGLNVKISFAEGGSCIAELARSAARTGGEIIVAGGGDGTINAVASELVGTDKRLGVLPLGTLNHFAKDLQIPLDLESAVRTIISGRVTSVDVGEVNGRYFLNNSSLGIYPSIVAQREQQQQRGRSKWPAFFSAVLAVMFRYPRLRVRLSIDGHELVRTTPIVFVGNNEYDLQGLNLGMRKCLNVGRLFLYVLHRTGRWGLARLALTALFAKIQNARDFDVLCAKEIWVETPREKVRVALDGEVTVMDTPLQYRVHPAALRVIVPDAKVEDSG